MTRHPQSTTPPVAHEPQPTHLQQTPQPPATPQHSRPVVPVGTLMVVAFLFLNIVFLWMLVLGIQQGRA